MLKKFLSILCLITIISTINCMEADDLDMQKPEEHKSTLDQEAVQFLKSQLAGFIEAQAEDTIIQILKEDALEEQEFVKRYLPYIYKAVHKAQLNDVIKFIEENLIINLNDKIRCALKINNRDTILGLIKWYDPRTTPGLCKLSFAARMSEHQEHLMSMDLEPIFLDRILCRIGVNFANKVTGQRYLNMLLRRNYLDNKYKKMILRLIANLSLEAINIQECETSDTDLNIGLKFDLPRNTALHEALYAYDNYKEKDENSMHNMEEIIEALIKKGADCILCNNDGIAPEDFTYFDNNKEKIQQWRAEYLKTITPQISEIRDSSRDKVDKVLDTSTKVNTALNNKSIKKKTNNSRKILTLAGISVAGAAAIFCFCYILLNKKVPNNTASLKLK